MREACSLVWSLLAVLTRSRASLDRLIFVALYRLVPGTLNALTLVKPDTIVRWHRAGFSPAPSAAGGSLEHACPAQYTKTGRPDR
jgi:hypothetical protein